MQRAWIISIGTELSLGQCVDTNAAWLASQLAALGITAERHITVADDLPEMKAVLRYASEQADLILITGGLGPTADDLTRQALAEVAGVDLVLDETSLAQTRAFFDRRNIPCPERNQVQALIPSSGRAIDNTCGTAPGVFVELGRVPCYAMPGVPFEMKKMFARDIQPALQKCAGRVLQSRRLNCYGMGESDIGERLRDLMEPGRNPQVGTTAALGVISVRINATAKTVEQAELLLDETETIARARLGSIVFGVGDGTLAAALGSKLVQRGQTVCTAESCTGGLIGKLLTDTAGSSEYYVGGAITYANEMKQTLLGVSKDDLATHGAVSEPVARAMADGARERFQADYALATTGIAGPAGGTPDKPVGLVYIALATPDEIIVNKRNFGGDYPREVIRQRAAQDTLNLLRQHLTG